MKKFIVPCFIVVDAESSKQADEVANSYRTMKNGSVLLLDETLPTVEIKKNISQKYPRSVIEFPEILNFFHV